MIRPSLLILSLWILCPTLAAACPEGDPNSTDYIRRDNNRCEGIANRRDSSSGISFWGITTHTLQDLNYPDTLTLKIPNLNTDPDPNLRIRARQSLYQMDQFELDPGSDFYSFRWPTGILQQANIAAQNLYPRATINSQRVFVPVILEQAGSVYTLVLFSNEKVKYSSIEIRSAADELIHRTVRTTFAEGEYAFPWDGNHQTTDQIAPAGLYSLSYQAEVSPIGEDPYPDSGKFLFQHDPAWLGSP